MSARFGRNDSLVLLRKREEKTELDEADRTCGLGAQQAAPLHDGARGADEAMLTKNRTILKPGGCGTQLVLGLNPAIWETIAPTGWRIFELGEARERWTGLRSRRDGAQQ